MILPNLYWIKKAGELAEGNALGIKKDIMTNKLIITNAENVNQSMDGVKWDNISIYIDVNITSNKELSNIINSLRLLRNGVPKKTKKL